MIQVTYCRERNLLTVKGHAGSDEYGKDLVCAAASALVLTMKANVERLTSSGCAEAPVIRLEEGDAEIGCQPKTGYRHSVRQIFTAVWVGFEALAEQWPEYISCRVQGW